MKPVGLDVRSVEPKHRFELIMGAYEDLAEGETLELTVDHDPRCMYYTLRATRGSDAFDFDYLESGPETWRVHVRKVGGDFIQPRGPARRRLTGPTNAGSAHE